MRELCPETGAGGEWEGAIHAAAANVCMTPSTSTHRWYALTVRHQHEHQTERTLRSQGWEALVPVYRAHRQWSDRVKEVHLPLFPCYVFCHFSLQDRKRVEDTPGVVSIVKVNGHAAAIAPDDMARVQAMLASKVPLSPWPYLKCGDRVRVERGPLRGLEGTLLRDGDSSRLVLSIEMLQRSVAAEVDPDMVVPLRSRAAQI